MPEFDPLRFFRRPDWKLKYLLDGKALPPVLAGVEREKQDRLMARGFPPDWFLPLLFAEKWRTPLFPPTRTAKDVAEWQSLLEGFASVGLNYDWRVHLKPDMKARLDELPATFQQEFDREMSSATVEFVSKRIMEAFQALLQGVLHHCRPDGNLLEDMAHDRELLRQYDPKLLEPPTRDNEKLDDERTTSPETPRAKRSTERGEAPIRLIAALTAHHGYEDGSCLNQDPIGNNKLARLAKTSRSTASVFFDEEFNGHTKYRSLCRDLNALVAALKLLNGEYSPHLLYGKAPPGEQGRED